MTNLSFHYDLTAAAIFPFKSDEQKIAPKENKPIQIKTRLLQHLLLVTTLFFLLTRRSAIKFGQCNILEKIP